MTALTNEFPYFNENDDSLLWTCHKCGSEHLSTVFTPRCIACQHGFCDLCFVSEPEYHGPKAQAGSESEGQKTARFSKISRAKKALSCMGGSQTTVRSTISKDNTAGERARQASLLAQYGKTTRQRKGIERLPQTSGAQRETLNDPDGPGSSSDFYDPSEDDRPEQTHSSYWSLAEAQDFPHLVRYYGRDWTAIARHMRSKSAIMVKNYYMRQTHDNPNKFDETQREREARFQDGKMTVVPPRRNYGQLRGRDQSGAIENNDNWMGQ